MLRYSVELPHSQTKTRWRTTWQQRWHFLSRVWLKVWLTTLQISTGKAHSLGDLIPSLKLCRPFSESSWVPSLALRCRRGKELLTSLRLKYLHPGFEVPFRKVPEELIKNGDTFDIMRLDGLDPMIGKNWRWCITLSVHLTIFPAWTMVVLTGHTAVAQAFQIPFKLLTNLKICSNF